MSARGGGTRKGAHFRIRAYDKVGILPVEVYERVGKSVISVDKTAQKG